jgi:hypothetical protein
VLITPAWHGQPRRNEVNMSSVTVRPRAAHISEAVLACFIALAAGTPDPVERAAVERAIVAVRRVIK